MLQLVGTECSKCGERLRSDRGAGGCLECEATFHLRCLEGDGSLCPECGADWKASWESAEKDLERDRALARRYERNRSSKRTIGRSLVLAGAAAALFGFIRFRAEVRLLAFLVGGFILTVGLVLFFLNRDRS